LARGIFSDLDRSEVIVRLEQFSKAVKELREGEESALRGGPVNS
jgi:hypothetical protein